MKEIEMTKNGDVWTASKASSKGYGRNPFEALGDLIFKDIESFGIVVHFPPRGSIVTNTSPAPADKGL